MGPTSVEFDLQSYLRDMESRITKRLDEGFSDLNGLDARVTKLEGERSYLTGAWQSLTLLVVLIYEGGKTAWEIFSKIKH